MSHLRMGDRLSPAQRARVQALEERFRHIERTRMADVPVCHPLLRVAAVGFVPDAAGHGLVGVLLTSWFMNVIWLPWPVEGGAAVPQSAGKIGRPGMPPDLAPGEKRERTVGAHTFEFIGAFEQGFGVYESCSLFSPMHEFQDQAAALATAQAVVDLLAQPPEAQAAASAQAAPAQPATGVADRRGFLFGRGGV